MTSTEREARRPPCRRVQRYPRTAAADFDAALRRRPVIAWAAYLAALAPT